MEIAARALVVRRIVVRTIEQQDGIAGLIELDQFPVILTTPENQFRLIRLTPRYVLYQEIDPTDPPDPPLPPESPLPGVA